LLNYAFTFGELSNRKVNIVFNGDHFQLLVEINGKKLYDNISKLEIVDVFKPEPTFEKNIPQIEQEQYKQLDLLLNTRNHIYSIIEDLKQKIKLFEIEIDKYNNFKIDDINEMNDDKQVEIIIKYDKYILSVKNNLDECCIHLNSWNLEFKEINDSINFILQ
jgi:hypothetical protein